MKIIAGEYLGTKAYIETRTPITYLDVHIKAGKRLNAEIPQSQNCFIYVWNGSGTLGSEGKKAKMGDVCNCMLLCLSYWLRRNILFSLHIFLLP